MSEKWFYALRGIQAGPVDLQTLKTLAVCGQLAPSDLVWRKVMPAWAEAATLAELRGAFPIESEQLALTIPPQLPPVSTRAVVAAPPPIAVVIAPPSLPPSSLAQAISRTPSGAPQARPAPALRMNKWTYIVGMYGVGVLGLLLTSAASLERQLAVLAPVGLLFSLASAGFFLVFIHRMWSAIDDGATRTRPGAACGLLCVPLFNLYWVFRALPGFVDEFNAYVARHAIPSARLSRGLYTVLAACIVFCALAVLWRVNPAPLVLLVVGPMVISRTCDAVNALAAGLVGANAHVALAPQPNALSMM